MREIIVAMSVYSGALLFHCLWHRVNVARGRVSLVPILVYGVGMVGLIILHTSMTAVVVYSVVVLLTIIFYFPITLSGQTPSDEVLTSLASGPKTRQHLLSVFDYDQLLGVRLTALTERGYIRQTKTEYEVTTKGRLVGTLILLVSKLMHIPVGG